MRTIVSLIAVSFLLACDRQADNAADSTNTSRVSGAASITQELRIDGMESDLVPIHAIAVAGDGTIAVIQSQDRLVRFFRSNGEPAGSFGAKGEGPGEFASLVRLGWLGDTLSVLDQRLHRITLISPSLTLVRTTMVPRSAKPAPADSTRIPSFPIIVPMSLYSDGTLHAGLFTSTNQVLPPAFKGSVAYGRINLDGVVQKIIAVPPNTEDEGSIRAGGSVASQPFSSGPSHAISNDGSRSAIAVPTGETGDSASITVTAFNQDGDTIYSREYRVEGVPLPKAVADSTIEARASEVQKMSPELAAAVRRDARVPKFYPTIAGLLVGRDGSVWIQLPDREAERAHLVIAADGNPLGLIFLPHRSRLGAAQRDRIWLLERDENDVQSIVRYRVDWRT